MYIECVLAAKEGSPDATIEGTTLRESASGAVIIKIACPSSERSCSGTVTLRTLDAVSAGSSTGKRAVLTLATGSFDVPGGDVKAVTLHLSGKARALLARTHVLQVRATVAARDPSGGKHTGQEILTLRGPKARHSSA